MIMETQSFTLEGQGVSAGKIRGKVKVVTGSEDADKFEDGNVLVTRITDPTMIMMMSQASAIVTDIGGMMSHPAIVSREMGIPCVVATKEATTKLKDGMTVEVDGTAGTVTVIQS
jgi:phosphoenolpyruvate synthase/pyruvate phosphate dikinase